MTVTINQLLLWAVCFSCLVFILRLARESRQQNRSWLIISGSVIAIAIFAYFLVPQIAGWLSALLWLLFILVPLIGSNRVNQLLYRQEYKQAYKLARILSWLHPTDDWRKQPEIFRALWLGQKGDLEKASQILNSYRAAATPLGRHATVILYWMGANWEQCRNWFEQLPPQIIQNEVNLIPYYIRSLGETGDLNELVQTGFSLAKVLQRNHQTLNLDVVYLFVFSFSGQNKQVQQLLNPTSSLYSHNIAQFWKLTLLLAKGQTLAKKQLQALKGNSDFILQNAIDWRLAHPPVNPDLFLTTASQQILAILRLNFLKQQHSRATFDVDRVKAYGTYILIALNLLVFTIQVTLGGSTDGETIAFLGALILERVWAGEWWRIITANFLHFGSLHLVMNMIGLWVIAPLVEHTLGMARFFYCYAISGIGTMALIAYLQLIDPNALLVGASAAIMGLVGAIVAIFLQNWQRDKSPLSAKRLRFLIFLIILQFFFDWIIPEVSFIAHALGVLLGFIFTNIILRISPKPQSGDVF